MEDYYEEYECTLKSIEVNSSKEMAILLGELKTKRLSWSKDGDTQAIPNLTNSCKAFVIDAIYNMMYRYFYGITGMFVNAMLLLFAGGIYIRSETIATSL